MVIPFFYLKNKKKPNLTDWIIGITLVILVSIALIFYVNKELYPSKIPTNAENTKIQDYKTIEETIGQYKFDIPLEGVTVESASDSYTNQPSYKIHVAAETTGAITTEGTLNIYSLKEIKWEDFYTQLQGSDGINSGGITPEKIQEGFKNAEDCIEQESPSTTPCHSDNKFGKTYVRVEKPYNRGQFPTGVFYIYRLDIDNYVVAYYEYSSRHSTANDFKILQSIAESIR